MRDSQDDEESEPKDGENPTDENATFGVFDSSSGEWLIDENGGDDGWTTNLPDAGRWNEGDAENLAGIFSGSDDAVIARQFPEPSDD